MNLLENRHAVITGASSGIGAAIAQILSENAVGRLTLIARREVELQAVADSCDCPTEVMPIDLSSEGAPKSVIDSIADTPVDLLINSAGIGRLSSLLDGDPIDWSEMMELNVLALARLTQALIPLFPEGGGHIVNISSMSGRRIPPSGGFYAVTKFALRAYSEALRSEFRMKGNQSRVTMISPGFVETALAQEYLGKAGQSIEDLGYDVLQPSDVAAAVLSAVTTSDHAEVNDILIRPRAQQT